jgi:hypothetical protein
MSHSRVISDSTGNLAECLQRISYSAAFQKALLMNSSGDQIPYVQPLLDVVGLFDELQIGYAMIGGVAAMYYGRARFTEDLDFVAVSGHMNVLAAHGDTMRRHHFDPACTHMLYHESGINIDVWKDQFSDEIVSRSREVELADRKVRIADPHDLIAMKLRAGRLRDDYDISEILRNQEIDDATIQSRVEPDQFQHYLEVKKRR